MSSINSMTLVTIKRITISEELAQDAQEVISLDTYITRAIENLVLYGAKKSRSYASIWSRLADVARDGFPEYDKDVHELRFDHITNEVIVQKRVH